MRSVYGWLRGHPLVVDSLLALVVVFLGISAVGHRDAKVPVALTVVLLVAMAIPVALRRLYPVWAFAAVLLVGGLELFTLPKPSGADLAVIILLYTVAAYRPRRVSLAALAVCLAGSVVAVLLWVPAPGLDSVYTFAGVAAVFAGPALLAWLLGDSMQWRRGYYRGLEERATRAERERDAQAQIAAPAPRPTRRRSAARRAGCASRPAPAGRCERSRSALPWYGPAMNRARTRPRRPAPPSR